MYISLFFLHLGFLYWQYRNWSSDEAEHPNYQNQNIKYQNSSISLSTHLFGLILKEGLSSKAITLFQACVYSKLFHAFRDFLYCFHIFPDFKHQISIYCRLSSGTVLNILQMFVASVCSFPKSLFFQATVGSCQAHGECIPVGPVQWNRMKRCCWVLSS